MLIVIAGLDEKERQARITKRGKDILDRILDNETIREKFLREFDTLLEPNQTIYVNNNSNIEEVVQNTYQKIKKLKS